MKKTILISLAGLCFASSMAFAQVPDAPGIYGECKDSFGNRAGISVEHTDVVTGVSRIGLLGQRGSYVQLSDGGRPVMRGLFAPFALDYLPIHWLDCIDVGVGSPSVVYGMESITGRVGIDYIDPLAPRPFFMQASLQNDTRADVSLGSALQFDKNLGTVLLAHADVNFMDVDMNRDGFLDVPRKQEVVLANRWSYLAPSGTSFRFGVGGVYDKRDGGRSEWFEDPWRTTISNAGFNGYFDMDMPLGKDGARKIAMTADYAFQNTNSTFGMTLYNAGEHLGFLNLRFEDASKKSFHYVFGISGSLDYYDEMFWRTRYAGETSRSVVTDDPLGEKLMYNNIGGYGEFTLLGGESFKAVLGIRGDWYGQAGFEFSPRLAIDWKSASGLAVKADAGRGLRYANPIFDNIGILCTGKDIVGLSADGTTVYRPLEDAWTFGANLIWHFGKEEKTYVGLDYHHVMFANQMLVDNTAEAIYLYTLDSMEGGSSWSGTFRADFGTELFRGFTMLLSGIYVNARQTLVHQSDDVKPMTSRFKGVLNLQYATPKKSWIFDFTASVNGPCKVWDFMKAENELYASGYTPIYPLLYAQVTKRFKLFDIYAGVENLTGFTQPSPVVRYEDPWAEDFDASCLWGPLMGAIYYAGVRINISK